MIIMIFTNHMYDPYFMIITYGVKARIWLPHIQLRTVTKWSCSRTQAGSQVQPNETVTRESSKQQTKLFDTKGVLQCLHETMPYVQKCSWTSLLYV